MAMTLTADVAILGAGVVGVAIARAVAQQFPKKRIVVFEKHEGACMETSRFNSGVLHSGIHQDPGLLKSQLAHEGSTRAAAYMTERGLPIIHTGMIIAVSRGALPGLYRELGSFWSLIKNGRGQGIDFKYLLPGKLRAMEPNLRTLGGMYIPNVWVIDPVTFVRSLEQEAKEAGVEFFFREPVENVRINYTSTIITTPAIECETKVVINAAGLYADDIARMAGFRGYHVFPWRGEYYEVIDYPNIVQHLVYPIVPHGAPGKGIHFGPRVDGRVFMGPNARLVPSKNYYTEDKTPVGEFLAAAQRFCPDIEAKNLRFAYSGIRPKLSATGEETDFQIRMDSRSPIFVNLIGIESPGLSSALAIATRVAGMLKGQRSFHSL